MKLLVLTTEPITARQLRDAVPDDVDPRQAEVAVVAPTLHEYALPFGSRMPMVTHRDREQRYRERVDAGEVENRFGVPVDRALVTSR